MVHNLSFVPAGGLTPAPAPLTGPLALATTTAPISAEVPLKLIYVTQVPIVGNVAVTVAENQTLDEVKRVTSAVVADRGLYIPQRDWALHSAYKATPHNMPIWAVTPAYGALKFSWHEWSASYQAHHHGPPQ